MAGRAFWRALQRAPRSWGGALALVVVLSSVLFPDRAWAGCGATDPGACMDNALYQGVLMLMALLWDINQTILLLARNVEALREWLVGDVLGTAFDAVVAGIQFPFWIAAAIAWLLFVIGYFLQALVDGLSWVNLKRLIQYGGLAMFLFHIGSQAMSVTETMRVSVGQGFAAIAGTSTSSSTTRLNFFAADDSSMDTPHTIYGDNPCPGMETKRTTTGMYLNDYTANYLWADARDIHCPDQAAGRADVPVQFGERYAPPPMQIDNEYPEERQKKINLGWVGVSRMGWGCLLVIGALVEQLMHLLFALALASTWIGLLIALLFALFLPTEGMFKGQIDGILTTMRVSWLASFWMGLALSVLNLAALSGNGLIVGGVGLLTLGLAVWQTKTAGETFIGAMSGLSGVAGNAPNALGGALKGMLGPAGMALGAVGALGSAAVGVRDAYGSYKQGRELGLERWQALDHAQAAWNQRSLNPLSIWRNQQRRTKAMVREKLLDERLIGQVADLHARQAQSSTGEKLHEQISDVADDTWAESRSYAAPMTELAARLDPALATSAQVVVGARTRVVVGRDTTVSGTSAQPAPQICPRCGQLIGRAHTCPEAESVDDARRVETPERPTATVTPTQTPGTTSAATGNGGEGMASAAPVTNADGGSHVAIVPETPAPAIIADDPAIQNLRKYARVGTTKARSEQPDADRPDLVAAASPTLALASAENAHPGAAAAKSEIHMPSNIAFPVATAETSASKSNSGTGDESFSDADLEISGVHAASPAAAVPTGTENGTAAPVPQIVSSSVQDVPAAPAPVSALDSPTEADLPPAVVDGMPAASSTRPAARAISVAGMPGATPEPAAGTANESGRTLLSSSGATRSSVSINSLPANAVRVPAPLVAVGNPQDGSAPVASAAGETAGTPHVGGAALPPSPVAPTTTGAASAAHGAASVAPAPRAAPVPAEAGRVQTPVELKRGITPSIVMPGTPVSSIAGQSAPVGAPPVAAAQSAPGPPVWRTAPSQPPAPTPVPPAHPAAPAIGTPDMEAAPVIPGRGLSRQRPWQRAQQRQRVVAARQSSPPHTDNEGRP